MSIVECQLAVAGRMASGCCVGLPHHTLCYSTWSHTRGIQGDNGRYRRRWLANNSWSIPAYRTGIEGKWSLCQGVTAGRRAVSNAHTLLAAVNTGINGGQCQ